jgi:hydroxyethylthiazole kinase-like uncharacterized protein yjeF
MTELLTAAQMRAIEAAAIASGEVTGLELMERAGRGVVEAILEWRPKLATAPHKAVVLCGPGNNGGDGFVVARLLKQRGWEVEVFLYGDAAKLPPDAAENCRRWREMGEIRPLDVTGYLSVAQRWGQRPEICVDALFGVGLTRPPAPDLAKALWAIAGRARGEVANYVPRRFVAIDCPSGLDMDSGKFLVADPERPASTPIAQLTVTFHRPRVGHFLSHGPSWCSSLRTVDIGLKGPLHRPCGFITTELDEDKETVALLDRGMARAGPTRSSLRKRHQDHKYAHGHALILAGGVGRGGAARLAARGALRIGAGLVTVGPPPAAIIENAARLDAIMLRPVADADALAEILEDQRFNALCLGPGLGVGAHTLGLAAAALHARRGTVLDADALTSFADDPPKLFALLHGNCVLTPHLGEFARLFPDIAEKLNEPAARGPAYSKVDAAREAATRAGCVILLKSSDTVIADPRGRASINSAHYERAAPWLATAGSGDVLAGMITGLFARGFQAMAAAETAAWLHVEAARKFGPGLIAEDLPEMIPAVFRDLGP